MLWGALLVAISLLNTKVHFFIINIGQKLAESCAPNMIDFGPKIRQIETFLNEINLI